MSANTIRNLLGVFFLGTTTVRGAYIILCQDTAALPISKRDATSAFQIIIPSLIAQVTIVFRWISNPPANVPDKVAIPAWAVVLPPLLVIAILVGTVILIVTDKGEHHDAGATFKNIVTFCESLLTATSVFIVARVFGGEGYRSKRRAAAEKVGSANPGGEKG